MGRPTDWHVLDLDKDPTPGDPTQVEALARRLHDFADDVGEALRSVKGLKGDSAVQTWTGLAADEYRSQFDGIPGELEKLERSYRMCGDALAAYWPKLQQAQGDADRALEQGRQAKADLATPHAQAPVRGRPGVAVHLDAYDRLTGVVTPDGRRRRYLYDPLGRRIAKLLLGDDASTIVERTDFTWDGTRLAEQTRWSPELGRRTTTWEWEPDSHRPCTQTERVEPPGADGAPGTAPGEPSPDEVPSPDTPSPEALPDQASPGEMSQDEVDAHFYAIVADLGGHPEPPPGRHG